MKYYEDEWVTLHHGDCLDVLAELPDCSVDAAVCDPPYGLEFMGKEWDGADGFRRSLNPNDAGRENVFGRASRRGPEYRAGALFQEWSTAWATEALRVLKPGGHMLAFGGTRTWHRLAVAVEDAGFEIRDSIAWLYGSGFPKSLDVSKAIDKAARGVHVASVASGAVGAAAEQWSGWGTALKPAFEPVVVARKPLTGTVAANVLAHGTGALNIDGCRIETTENLNGGGYSGDRREADGASSYAIRRGGLGEFTQPAGRWPANVVLDEDQAAALDEQSRELASGTNPTRRRADRFRDTYGEFKGQEECMPARGADTGGASRFFYTAKASSDERVTHKGVAHPTVKPLSLMRWLVRLVTPPGGVILEPFAGSGTTVEAAILEGFKCVAVERESTYLPLITQRINRRRDPVAYLGEAGEDMGLFGPEDAA